MDLIIDGYNVIGAEQGLTGALEAKRNWLLQRLINYRKIKQFRITLVFDGWRSGSREEALQTRDGVAVVYSKLGEKADAVIIRLARAKGSGCVVVTSDREIRNAIERFGAVAVSAAQFSEILHRSDGGSEDESCYEDEDDGHSEKYGRRRGSKLERRRNEKIKKLRL